MVEYLPAWSPPQSWHLEVASRLRESSVDKCRLWACVADLVPRPFVMIIGGPGLSDLSILSALILEVQRFARLWESFLSTTPMALMALRSLACSPELQGVCVEGCCWKGPCGNPLALEATLGMCWVNAVTRGLWVQSPVALPTEQLGSHTSAAESGLRWTPDGRSLVDPSYGYWK